MPRSARRRLQELLKRGSGVKFYPAITIAPHPLDDALMEIDALESLLTGEVSNLKGAHRLDDEISQLFRSIGEALNKAVATEESQRLAKYHSELARAYADFQRGHEGSAAT